MLVGSEVLHPDNPTVLDAVGEYPVHVLFGLFELAPTSVNIYNVLAACGEGDDLCLEVGLLKLLEVSNDLIRSVLGSGKRMVPWYYLSILHPTQVPRAS